MAIWRLVVLLSAALAGTQGNARTVFKDGNALIEEMREFEQAEKTHEGTFNAGLYMGFVVGVADTWSGVIWCPGGAGNRVTVRQVTTTVGKYMNNNPDKWHLEARTLVINALQQAFPCKK